MAEKQKPDPYIVKVAARVIKNPDTATLLEIRKMAARILDDQKNDPEPNWRAAPKRKLRRASQ